MVNELIQEIGRGLGLTLENVVEFNSGRLHLLWTVRVTFARMCAEFATLLQPFILLRSPLALGNKAAIHVGETYNAKRSVVKIMCGTKRGV
jgi:hypothetical protein